MTNLSNQNYTPIVGLEIHVELKTKSKMFCSCSASHFQVKPNTHTCPICLGLPGALPVPNKKAIESCQLIGLALNCKLAKFSKFDRKNYFYPDLPKGYQISQYDQPFCIDGVVELENGTKIGITRVHMEEDTAKNIHKTINSEKKTLVDFNRSSVPLVEIVTEPDFRSSKDIDKFLKNLRRIIRYLGVSDADMEKGSMRLELNMSLTTQNPSDTNFKFPPYKVEVKNINSFRYLQKAFEYEFIRQAEILDRGEYPIQETRGYQEDVNRTISQRSKEDAQDYRYFPEPDIPPFVFSQDYFSKLKSQLPELPHQKQSKYQNQFKLPLETALFLVEDISLADYFEKAILIDKEIKSLQIANSLKNKKYDWTKLSPEQLVEKIKSESSDKISDNSELDPIIRQVIESNPDAVASYKKGKSQIIGFLIGQVMKQSKRKANPQIVKVLFEEKLK